LAFARLADASLRTAGVVATTTAKLHDSATSTKLRWC
jgi:hypothetical protein